jgi:hypothetical protein
MGHSAKCLAPDSLLLKLYVQTRKPDIVRDVPRKGRNSGVVCFSGVSYFPLALLAIFYDYTYR